MNEKQSVGFANIRRRSKRDRVSEIERLTQRMVEDSYQDRQFERVQYPSKRGIHNRVRDALFEVGNTALWYRINKCYYNPYGDNYLNDQKYGLCKSYWCVGCRNRIALQNLSKIKSRIDDGRWMNQLSFTADQHNGWYYNDEGQVTFASSRDKKIPKPQTIEYKNENIRQINGILGICKVRIDDVQTLIKQDTNRWRRIKRRLDKLTKEHYWIETTYELELVSWQHLKNAKQSDYKKKQIQFLIRNTNDRFSNETFLFVHWHGLTNLDKDQINEVFEQEYFINGERVVKTNHDTGLYVQELQADKSLEDNIKKLASYPFKSAMRFKHSFIGSDYLNGEPLIQEELGRLITVTDELYGRQGRSLFRSFSNELPFWHQVEVRLEELIKTFQQMDIDNKRMFMGERYTRNDLVNELQRLAKSLNKIRSGDKSISIKSVTSLVRDNKLIKRYRDKGSLYWKLEIPDGKKSVNSRLFDGIWKSKSDSSNEDTVYYI